MFERLYAHYEKPIYHFLLAKTRGDKTAAEDVFSDTFASAFSSLPTLTGKGNLQGWLLRIASRRLADHLRKAYRERKKNRPLTPAYPAEEDALAGLLEREEQAIFELALERLRPEHRRALMLKYDERRSVTEIAERDGVPESTVEGRLRRARRSLQKVLRALRYEEGRV